MIYFFSGGEGLQESPQGGVAIWSSYCAITDRYIKFASHFGRPQISHWVRHRSDSRSQVGKANNNINKFSLLFLVIY